MHEVVPIAVRIAVAIDAILSDDTQQFCCRGLLHADVGEELLACVLQACAEDIDRIVDNQETIVVVLTDIDSDRRILLVVAL